jgi:CheY-like chemotaxis protein
MEPLVLVVDDDDEIVAFLDEAIQEVGYRVLTSVNGKALPLARDEQPSVILLDIHMPGMDGIEVSRRLRADPMTAHIPIVVMSTIERIHALSGQLAVDDRLPKPFTLDRLYSTLERWAPITG